MSKVFPEDMKCPICLDIPRKEIFQCQNGHIVCHVCVGSISTCPQCRVALSLTKIRNRAVENLLDSMSFNCLFTAKGCRKDLSRREIAQHYETCEFGGESTNFCQFLGFNCNFKMNTRRIQEAITHSCVAHKFLKTEGNCIEARLLDFFVISAKAVTWTPLLIAKNNTILIICITCIDHSLAISGFYFGKNADKTLIEFRFASKSSQLLDIKWLMTPVCLEQAEFFLQYPAHMTSTHLLSNAYLEDSGDLHVNITIHGETFPRKVFSAKQVMNILPLDDVAPVSMHNRSNLITVDGLNFPLRIPSYQYE